MGVESSLSFNHTQSAKFRLISDPFFPFWVNFIVVLKWPLRSVCSSWWQNALVGVMLISLLFSMCICAGFEAKKEKKKKSGAYTVMVSQWLVAAHQERRDDNSPCLHDSACGLHTERNAKNEMYSWVATFDAIASLHQNDKANNIDHPFNTFFFFFFPPRPMSV